MRVKSLVEHVELRPSAAKIAFNRTEQALNLLLPNSDAHSSRYKSVGSVGLAVVIARDDVLPNSYNPLDPAAQGRTLFRANNRWSRPETWQLNGTEEEMLGAAVPDGMGKYTAFALSKINALTTNDASSSYRLDKINIEPGQVGFAGGIRVDEALLGVSGLWEVHDHVVSRVYANEVIREVTTDTAGWTANDLAGVIVPIFDRIKLLHGSTDAIDLDRSGHGHLLVAADEITTQQLAA